MSKSRIKKLVLSISPDWSDDETLAALHTVIDYEGLPSSENYQPINQQVLATQFDTVWLALGESVKRYIQHHLESKHGNTC